MSYVRINVYKAQCAKHLKADCQNLGPSSQSIERAFSNACEDGWKMIANREAICPQCLIHIRSGKDTLLLPGRR